MGERELLYGERKSVSPLPEAVSYQLLIEVGTPQRLRIGRLGVFDFPAGRYVYTGSARRGLEKRVARHLQREKRLHWHIDFLLAACGVTVVAVRRSVLAECSLHQRTPGILWVPGFGASDCRGGCISHLKYLGF
ncbi:MAG: GIY-YIG nuclease family protein [Hydrogenophilus sp.]|nr:GIY-YIG nuclease family protein [Hydrogenophilus sp.]